MTCCGSGIRSNKMIGMKQFSWLAMLMLTAVQTLQVNVGVIAGRVLSPKSLDGIPDVQITLVGPSPVASLSALGALYEPSPALTPAMRDQIDNLINAAPPTVALEAVANAAIRMEAQLLGLPIPTLQNPAPAPPSQAGATTDREGAFVFRKPCTRSVSDSRSASRIFCDASSRCHSRECEWFESRDAGLEDHSQGVIVLPRITRIPRINSD